MDDVTAALAGRRHRPGARSTPSGSGRGRAINPGVVATRRRRAPHQPPGPPGTGPAVTFARSGLTTAWSDGYASVLELAEACDVPDAVVVPHRRLPHLRHGGAVRRGVVRRRRRSRRPATTSC